MLPLTKTKIFNSLLDAFEALFSFLLKIFVAVFQDLTASFTLVPELLSFPLLVFKNTIFASFQLAYKFISYSPFAFFISLSVAVKV